MSRPMIRVHNIETDEIIDREMNDVEFSQYQANQAAQAERQAEAQARATGRQTILNRLGLTEEEARLLLGGN